MLLVGHGSHLSGASARPVHDLAARLRGAETFSEVRVAFWKEEPQLRHAFDLIEARDVFVVPVFTSVGYFTDRVVPRELGLDGPVTERAGHRIHQCRAVGTHPAMSRVVLARAREAAPLDAAATGEAALVIVGHGTDRHPESGETTEHVVHRLRSGSGFGRVEAAFLDQEPHVVRVLDGLEAPNVVVVPFFISEGWHAGTTLPRDLALTGGRTRRNGSTIWYGLPVGTHPRIADVVVELVDEAAAEQRDAEGGDDFTEPPARQARQDFLDWIRRAGTGPREFLQTWIRTVAPDAYEVRHLADAGRPDHDLEELVGPEAALSVAATTEKGRHRALRTAPDLRTGWRLTGLDGEGLWEAFAHLYPTVPVHGHLLAQGRLSVTSFREAASRQTGMYADVERHTDAQVQSLVDRCCNPERCLRQPVWSVRPGGTPLGNGSPSPCPEPCSIFISMAKRGLDSASGSE